MEQSFKNTGLDKIVRQGIFRTVNLTSLTKGNDMKYRTQILAWRPRNYPKINPLKKK